MAFPTESALLYLLVVAGSDGAERTYSTGCSRKISDAPNPSPIRTFSTLQLRTAYHFPFISIALLAFNYCECLRKNKNTYYAFYIKQNFFFTPEEFLLSGKTTVGREHKKNKTFPNRSIYQNHRYAGA